MWRKNAHVTMRLGLFLGHYPKHLRSLKSWREVLAPCYRPALMLQSGICVLLKNKVIRSDFALLVVNYLVGNIWRLIGPVLVRVQTLPGHFLNYVTEPIENVTRLRACLPMKRDLDCLAGA